MATIHSLPRELLDNISSLSQLRAQGEEWIVPLSHCAGLEVLGRIARWRFHVEPESKVTARGAVVPFTARIEGAVEDIDAWRASKTTLAGRGLEFLVDG